MTIMDFTTTDEQEQMREAAAELVDSLGQIDPARQQIDGEDAAVGDVWDELSEADYTALTIPFEYGGLGEGILYLALILEVTGRVALPGPYPETAAVGVPLLASLGTETQKERYLTEIAAGDHRMTVALLEPEAEDPPHGIQLSAEEAGDGDGFVLSGTKTLVPYGGTADTVIVAARTDEGTGYDAVSLFLVEPSTLDATHLDSVDKTRPVYELAFDDVSVTQEALLGPLHGGGDALERALDRYEISLSAMLVGAAERAVELSVEHGQNRVQYGHPIGRYQAMKHRTADMWMDLQASRSLCYAAAWELANDRESAPRTVSAAKAYLSENAASLFHDDIQNHGGIGFTTDHDAHIYAKQAKSLEHYPRSADFHWERVAEAWRV
jgi:alkylation response protein AidB-like acyl-CoA dehydrogenase